MAILLSLGLVHEIEGKTHESKLLNYHLTEIVYNYPDSIAMGQVSFLL